MMRRVVLLSLALLPLLATAQFNVDRLIMSGRSALYYEDYVLAIQHFNRAIDSKPYLYEPWFYRGVAKFYLDDFAGAERDCSEAISLNPYVTGIYELRGLCRIRLKKFESAISDYDRALKDEPTAQNFWYTPTWDSSTQIKDFETTSYYSEYEDKTASHSDSGGDYSWDSGDSWDSGTTDWDSDW